MTKRPKSNVSESCGPRLTLSVQETWLTHLSRQFPRASKSADRIFRKGREHSSHSDLLPAVLDEIDAVGARSAIGSFRIPTGFDDLDSLLGGWSQGCLIIIGGRPSSGKTTLLLNFCRAASIKYRSPSMAISGEMSGREKQTRTPSAEARVPLYTIRTGKMTEEDRHRVARATAVIADAPIHIGTRSEFGIDQISADVTALAQASGLKLLIIDGLQWMADRQASAELSTEFFLWRLKRLAETLKIPIIITAQAERVRGRLPTTANSIQQLKDSDAIERVADVVIMLHRPDQDDMEHPRAGEAELIVAKNRNGPTATKRVCYQYHYCRVHRYGAQQRSNVSSFACRVQIIRKHVD